MVKVLLVLSSGNQQLMRASEAPRDFKRGHLMQKELILIGHESCPAIQSQFTALILSNTITLRDLLPTQTQKTPALQSPSPNGLSRPTSNSSDQSTTRPYIPIILIFIIALLNHTTPNTSQSYNPFQHSTDRHLYSQSAAIKARSLVFVFIILISLHLVFDSIARKQQRRRALIQLLNLSRCIVDSALIG
eukprot:TRINITY_DN1001_c0_g1_i9.p1 TRINITY_DN1001_c0_g1~~TRINITY_DN1001_c0_g1_i9.p1  ORF type:complete len:190 (-),score=22.43 TRINITY_DN1001_c0_g1_i9:37-606(-)